MNAARWRWKTLAAACLFAISISVEAGSGRIIKVLPHFLDSQGRHTIHPSLFERDVYQATLKKAPELRSTMRFDVQWKAKRSTEPVRLRLEARGLRSAPGKMEIVESVPLKAGRFSRWTELVVPREVFERMGEVAAWRLTLLEGNDVLSEHKSFLW